MKTISKHELNNISGGLVVWQGNSLKITGDSIFTMNGLVFQSDSICFHSNCTSDIYNKTLKYELPVLFNGKNSISIKAEKIYKGTLYKLS